MNIVPILKLFFFILLISYTRIGAFSLLNKLFVIYSTDESILFETSSS
jgi:hypothetical protein